MNNLAILEVREVFESVYDHYSKTITLKNASRSLVKHYKLNDSCVNDETIIKSKIQNMVDAHWFSFSHRFEDLDVSNGQCVKVLTCSPLRFNHIDVEVDLLKPFIFTYVNSDGIVEISVEMNYSFEVI